MTRLRTRHLSTSDVDGTPYRIPYWEVDSGRPGPRILITAALHGTELNGCEVLRRLLPVVRRDLQKGACLLVPLANLLALRRNQQRIDYLQGSWRGGSKGQRDGTWPGDPAGSSWQRAAAAIQAGLIEQATHAIDLHSWNHTWAPAALARSGYRPSLELARATGLRFARHAEWMSARSPRPVTPCTLSSYFNDTGRAAIAIELAGQNVMDTEQVRLGLRALRNCLRLLEMLPGCMEAGDVPQVWINDARETTVDAPCSGLFISARRRLNAAVKRGAVLGRLLREEDLKTLVLRAPADGYLYRYGSLRIAAHDHGDHQRATHPFVLAGESLATLLTPPGA